MIDYKMIDNLVSNELRNHMSYDTTKGHGLYPFGSIVSHYYDELVAIIRGCMYGSDEV